MSYIVTPLTLPASPRQKVSQLRDVYREAFDLLGGADWLVDFASRNDGNARTFVQCLSKLLPQTINATVKSVKLENLTDEEISRMSIAELSRFVIDAEYEHVPNQVSLPYRE